MSEETPSADRDRARRDAAALRESDERFRLQAAEVLENVSDAFYAVDGQWRFTYVNRNAERIWGIRRERLLGRNLWEAFPASMGSELHGEMLRAAAERRAAHVEIRSAALGGAWLSVNVYPSGDGLAVYFRDVTERREAEEQRYWLLRQAQSRAAELAAVMESIPDALFIGNAALVTLANAPALDLLGCGSLEELNGDLQGFVGRARIRDATTGGTLPPDRWPFDHALEGGGHRVRELVVRHARLDRDVLLRCATSPARLNNEIIGAVSLNTDIRRSRDRFLVRGLLNAHEEERRAVAYELHDGLTQYVMAAHAHLEAFRALRQEAAAPPEAADADADVERELGRGLECLRRAVQESRRLVSGLRALALDDLGLAGALELLLAEEKARAGWREAEFVHNAAGRRFDALLETAAYRVAQEALTNARKHARTERVRLVLVAGADEGTGKPDLTLEVRDWGRGFRPEEKAGEYSHLGLPGMAERVGLLGGAYRLRSAPGQGTLVRAVFPVAAPGLPAETEATEAVDETMDDKGVTKSDGGEEDGGVGGG
uniref:Chemotaxis protein methyltransferase CheR n=1 Tax=uncultured Armatimonadetes bacterium TaxID=157466 RepID=A0A6J4JL64_9BACT|nr:Chemotaxis protein methyltransferase CheR [uncultured Armatimonadetes bacterium]